MADSTSKTTIDHEEIQAWAEDRGGSPAKVSGTETEDSALLRIKFDEDEETLEEISWEEFFDIFEKSKLAFLYQEESVDGSESHFFKFVQRGKEGDDTEGAEDDGADVTNDVEDTE